LLYEENKNVIHCTHAHIYTKLVLLGKNHNKKKKIYHKKKKKKKKKKRSDNTIPCKRRGVTPLLMHKVLAQCILLSNVDGEKTENPTNQINANHKSKQKLKLQSVASVISPNMKTKKTKLCICTHWHTKTHLS
jgi:hypothetical protein